MSAHENGIDAAKLLGIPNRRKKTAWDSANEKTPETAWEIYNNRAIVYDKELIKDWNDGLSTLLIFVSRSILTKSALIKRSST
jgi:hypothetical protein